MIEFADGDKDLKSGCTNAYPAHPVLPDRLGTPPVCPPVLGFLGVWGPLGLGTPGLGNPRCGEPPLDLENFSQV